MKEFTVFQSLPVSIFQAWCQHMAFHSRSKASSAELFKTEALFMHSKCASPVSLQFQIMDILPLSHTHTYTQSIKNRRQMLIAEDLLLFLFWIWSHTTFSLEFLCQLDDLWGCTGKKVKDRSLKSRKDPLDFLGSLWGLLTKPLTHYQPHWCSHTTPENSGKREGKKGTVQLDTYRPPHHTHTAPLALHNSWQCSGYLAPCHLWQCMRRKGTST